MTRMSRVMKALRGFLSLFRREKEIPPEAFAWLWGE